MELEFDKEIDAILRKARSGIGVSDATTGHLDADAITAFAENALPDKAKLFAVGHFADCSRCRKQLAFLVQMNRAEAIDASPLPAPVVASAIPWFQKLFKVPNLALASGALILVFSGVLGYLVIQKQNTSDNATVSQVKEQEQPRGGVNFDTESGMANAAPVNVMKPAANAAAATNAATDARRVSNDTSSGPSDRSDADQVKTDAASENNFQLDGAAAAPAEPAAKAVAPPPVTTTSGADSIAGAELDLKQSGDGRQAKEESKDLALAKQKRAEDRGRDTPRAAAKSVPSRSGPAQNQQNQLNSNMPVTRVVAGKTFNNRNGAWYDSAYQNQATLDYRRGTAEYKKLDSALRAIADAIGGTVVVVWKSKAYRIQ